MKKPAAVHVCVVPIAPYMVPAGIGMVDKAYELEARISNRLSSNIILQ